MSVRIEKKSTLYYQSLSCPLIKTSFPSFCYLLTCTVSLHPFTKIPVRNDQPQLFSICICDVIQVCYACFQKWYTSILLLTYPAFKKSLQRWYIIWMIKSDKELTCTIRAYAASKYLPSYLSYSWFEAVLGRSISDLNLNLNSWLTQKMKRPKAN